MAMKVKHNIMAGCRKRNAKWRLENLEGGVISAAGKYMKPAAASANNG